MRRRNVAIIIAVAVVMFFFLAPVTPLIPSDKQNVIEGYMGWAAYYSYSNLTIVYWSHVAYYHCPSGISCPPWFSNESAPEYLSMPTSGSLSYYFLGSGGLVYNYGYTIAICLSNSSNVFCYLPVPCLNNNIPWPHDSCF